jgi:hypothetical protein
MSRSPTLTTERIGEIAIVSPSAAIALPVCTSTCFRANAGGSAISVGLISRRDSERTGIAP